VVDVRLLEAHDVGVAQRRQQRRLAHRRRRQSAKVAVATRLAALQRKHSAAATRVADEEHLAERAFADLALQRVAGHCVTQRAGGW